MEELIFSLIITAFALYLSQVNKRLSLNFIRKMFIKGNAEKLLLNYPNISDTTLLNKSKVYVLRDEGVEHEVTNIVTGTVNNLTITLFDLLWVKNVNGKRKFCACSIFMVKAENKSLPEFHIKPNKRKYFRCPGITIDFNESPDFHSRYLLFSDDVQRTQKIISYEVAQLISKRKNLCFEVDGDVLFIWSPCKIIPIMKYNAFYEYATSVASKIFK